MKNKFFYITVIAIFIIGKLSYKIYHWNTPYEIIIQGPRKEIHTGRYTTNEETFYYILGVLVICIIIYSSLL